MPFAPTTDEAHPRYKDPVFRCVVSAPVAIYMMLYREEAGFFEAFFYLNFWIGTAFSYLISVLLFWLVNRLSAKLDTVCDWRRDTLRRILHQLVWGVVGIALLTFILVTVYFSFFGINIMDTTYLRYDYPLVVLIIILANLYYLIYYLWNVSTAEELPASENGHAEPDNVAQQENGGNGEKGLFLAQTVDAVLVIPQSRIAAIYRDGDYVVLRTFDRETYTLEQTIVNIITELNPDSFFKINPRYIVNYKLCKSFRNGKYGKLDLELGPPINGTEAVSRAVADDFRKWMDR